MALPAPAQDKCSARRRDRPPFKVLGNNVLLALSRTTPRSLQGMAGIEGFPPRLADRYGRSLLHVIEQALDLPEAQLPRYPRGERRERDPALEKRLARLKAWRLEKAAELEIDPGILINNAGLEEIAGRQPRISAELAEIPGMKNWQRRVLGEEILTALAGSEAE